MFELKKLTPAGIDGALERVERYRLLNEPAEAESICLDVLDTDPDNQEALVQLLLSRADQLETGTATSVSAAQEVLSRLRGDYEREYYAGIICERRADGLLRRGTRGSRPMVYEWYRKAMVHFEAAERIRPEGNDDAIVRWNTCARMIMRHNLEPAAPLRAPSFLE